MKTDKNGCSTCPPGRESFEEFTTPKGNVRVQYDYRTPSGELFSCVAPDLDTCRRRRDEWIKGVVDPYNRL